MCGISGIVDMDGRPVSFEMLEAMTGSIKHRGPDGSGFWLGSMDGGRFYGGAEADAARRTTSVNIGFGHRRLSIIDLSEAGAQPMCSGNGRFWITYNGEVYNYIELRDELCKKGYKFRTDTDTEVILAAYEEWGEECLSRFNGMWAFVILDLKGKTLFCARDRMGVKPFYYTYDGRRFAFASEIKALLHTGVERRVNGKVAHDYLVNALLDYSEETFFEGIKQLRPAHSLKLSKQGVVIKKWWDIRQGELCGLSDAEYAEKFYALFEDSVRLRLRSDVPVGTCLSGGLDSSSIVCVANKLMLGGNMSREIVGERQRTFSSCFDNRKYDERVFIEEVLNKTGARAHYTFPKPESFFDILPDVLWHQDEPFGSTSIYAQWHVMKLVRESGVKVLLDGQGADEMLAGYHSYFGFYYGELARQRKLIKLIGQLWHHKKLHGASGQMPYVSILSSMLPDGAREYLKNNGAVRFFLAKESAPVVWLDGNFAGTYGQGRVLEKKFDDGYKNILYDAFVNAGLPALLHYEDRNSMAFSVEARVPFLDYRLVELVFSLPTEQKFDNGLTKVVLRNAMKDVLPEKIRTRIDKMGFVTPESVWMRGEFAGRIRDILGSKISRESGFFNVPEILREFDTFLKSGSEATFTVWRWVNLILWKEMFIEGNGWRR